MRRIALVGIVGLLLALPGRASLYQPDDSMPFPVNEKGVAEALPFDEFKRRLIVVMNQLNPAPQPDGKVNTDRVRLMARVEKRRAVPKPTQLDTLALASDLLHLGTNERGAPYADEALNLLKPLDNRRRPEYLVTTALAHVHAARGEWQVAMDKQLSLTVDELEMPAEVKGLSKTQRKWVAKLDSDYVLAYFKLMKHESEKKPNPTEEDVYPLFPLPERNKPHAPVRFVNNSGEYEPGTIADAEKAKLPPDAIAIMQQMMLWFPGDARLYWLLAELYAAEGQIDAAQTIMNECVDSRKFAGRRILMEHRAAVMTAVEKKLKDDEDRRRQAFPVSMRMIALYFAIVGVVAAWAGLRAFRRWQARR